MENSVLVDLSSPDPGQDSPPKRSAKRLRRQEASVDERALEQPDGRVISLVDTPTDCGTGLANSRRLADGSIATKPEKPEAHWGEIIDSPTGEDPPRWRGQGRKRSNTRAPRASYDVNSSATSRNVLDLTADQSPPGFRRPAPTFRSLNPEGHVSAFRPPRLLGAASADTLHARARERTRLVPATGSLQRPVPVLHSNHGANGSTYYGGQEDDDLSNLLLARQYQQDEDASLARELARHSMRSPGPSGMAAALEAMQRRGEEADFNQLLDARMDELEELERAADWHPAGGRASFNPRARPSHRRRGWASTSLADAMMSMLEAGPFGGQRGAALPTHMSAMRDAFAGMAAGRLPPELLFSDRDFNENDYEALLALDEQVENRKGASVEVIDVLPTVVVPAGGPAADADTRCSICLEDVMAGAVMRRLPCRHQFHKCCVDRWLQTKASCPICQASLK